MDLAEFERRRKRKPIKKLSLKTEIENTIRSLIITLTIMIVILMVAFLALTNENAQRGYTLQQLKQQNEDLKNENSNLKAKILYSTSYQEIKEQEKVDQMTPTEEKTYVTEDDRKVR